MSIVLQLVDYVFRARFLSATAESPVWNTVTVSAVSLELFFVVFACALLVALARPSREPLAGPSDPGRFASPGGAPADADWVVWQPMFADREFAAPEVAATIVGSFPTPVYFVVISTERHTAETCVR